MRRRLSLDLAKAPLETVASPGVSVKAAEAAVFEGRHAAEHLVSRHAPALVAETAACFALVPFVGVHAAELASCLVLAILVIGATALTRSLSFRLMDRAWEEYLAAARGILISFGAATELLASGRQREHVDRVRRQIDSWIGNAATAERVIAMFERLPLALVIAFLLILNARHAIDIAAAVRIAILLPPLAGLSRSAFDTLRVAPKLETLDLALHPTSGVAESKSSQLIARPPCSVQVKNASFRYSVSQRTRGAKEVALLDAVSFAWEPGTVLGIRGPNGSGKSTMLKLMLGLLVPDAGTILVGGKNLREVDLLQWRQAIAYLPQRPYLPPDFTVREVMRLVVPDLPDAEAQSALELTDVWNRLVVGGNLDGPLDTPIGELSSGERQRILLARALSQQSTMLLLDEPDENLDSTGRAILFDLVRRLRPKIMIAFAAHDSELLNQADQIVELGRATPVSRRQVS
jgi:ABC-type multidrug transport system fused ATPase/permease subunit